MASVNVTITAGADDVSYDSANATFEATDIVVRAGYITFMGPFNWHAGLRFPAVDVPQGATVTSATITLYVTNIVGAPDLTIRANGVNDAAAWADSAGDRPSDMGAETTASLSPTITGTGQKSFDVTPIVQEIVDRGGFAQGAMRFQFKNNSGSANSIRFESQEESSPTYGPAQLDITYPSALDNFDWHVETQQPVFPIPFATIQAADKINAALLDWYVMPQVNYISAYPVNAPSVFPSIYVGDGGVSDHEEGLGVAADIDVVGSDVVWRLRFWMPEMLPGGTAKLKLWALADAVTNSAKVNPKWASVAQEEDPSSIALNAEGTTTITWAAADDDVYKEAKIALDADTIIAGEMVVMDLVFETAGWTLDVASTWHAAIIWE